MNAQIVETLSTLVMQLLWTVPGHAQRQNAKTVRNLFQNCILSNKKCLSYLLAQYLSLCSNLGLNSIFSSKVTC